MDRMFSALIFVSYQAGSCGACPERSRVGRTLLSNAFDFGGFHYAIAALFLFYGVCAASESAVILSLSNESRA